MKALTLTQPWASLVAVGAKTLETRSWSTGYRGEVAIHAAKGYPTSAKVIAESTVFRETLKACGVPVDWEGLRHGPVLPTGAIVAVGRLHSCLPALDALDLIARRRVQSLTVRTDLCESEDVRDPALAAAFYVPRWELTFGDYSPGRYAFVLTDVRPLATPVPCRGMLSLWQVPEDVEAAVRAQLPAARVA